MSDSDAESQMTLPMLQDPTPMDRDEALRRNPVFWTPKERDEYRAARQTKRKAQKRKHEGLEKRPILQRKMRRAEKGEHAESQSSETPVGLFRDKEGRILGSLRTNSESDLSTRSAVKVQKRRQRTL